MKTRRLQVRTLVGAVAVVALAALSLQGCAVVNGSGDDPNTLRVMMGADTTYPKERKQWQQDTAAEFKRTTGADIQWETYSSAQEELTAIQTSVISGQGPDVYAIGTTFTPTAYATGAFVRDGREGVEGDRRQGPVRPGVVRHLRSERVEADRHPVRQPPVRDGGEQGPAREGRHHRDADDVGPADRRREGHHDR